MAKRDFETVSTSMTPVNVVALLEQKLAAAKRGEFRAVGFVAVYHGNTAVNHGWAADRGGCIVTLLGAVYRLANMLQTDLDTTEETLDAPT